MALSYNELGAMANKLILADVTDGKFFNDQFLNRLLSNKVTEPGGDGIKAPRFSVDETGTTGGFYSPRDALSLADYQGITASEHVWKYLQESLVIYHADIASQANDAKRVSMVDAKYRQMKMALNERIKKGVLSDGTASTGELTTKQYVGLQAIISATDTYGGIAVADDAAWASFEDLSIGTLTLPILDALYDQANEGDKGAPTLALLDKNVFTKVKGLLQSYQRVMAESSLDKFGHKGVKLVYNGVDHLVENNMPAQQIFYIDEKHCKLHVQKDNFMRTEYKANLETADAQLNRIFLYSALVATERKYHSKGTGITV